jgi:esterase/lipase superfamily enzyme
MFSQPTGAVALLIILSLSATSSHALKSQSRNVSQSRSPLSTNSNTKSVSATGIWYARRLPTEIVVGGSSEELPETVLTERSELKVASVVNMPQTAASSRNQTKDFGKAQRVALSIVSLLDNGFVELRNGLVTVWGEVATNEAKEAIAARLLKLPPGYSAPKPQVVIGPVAYTWAARRYSSRSSDTTESSGSSDTIELTGAVPNETVRRHLIATAKVFSESVTDRMVIRTDGPTNFEGAARTVLLQLAGSDDGLAVISNGRVDLLLSARSSSTEDIARKELDQALPVGFTSAAILMANRARGRHYYRRNGPPFKVVTSEDAASRGVEDPRIVDLLYATNRKPEPDGGFSGERATTMTFGAARIRIPKDHKLGRIELPVTYKVLGFTLYQENEDPDQHFIVQSETILDRAQWDTIIDTLKPTDALVFVHGYNTSFNDALLREAQIVWDLQFAGLPVLFSWPSRGKVLDYEYDRESALGARSDFIDLLKILKKEHGIERVHVVAHSMGNLVALDALSSYSQTQDPIKISQVIMAAPDVDSDQFRGIIPKIHQIVEGLTLYASSADRALMASKKIAGNIFRAGDVPVEGPIVLPGLETIDVTAMGAEMFGLNHDTFASDRSLIDDIGLLISERRHAPRLSQIRQVPEKPSSPRYWRYAP